MTRNIKQNIRPKQCVACIGKSTLSVTSQDYQTIVKIGSMLIENGFGVVHGGYAGGAMSAVNEGAHRMSVKLGRNYSWNRGILMKSFQNIWPTVKHGSFCKPVKSLGQRMDKIIGESDIVVVLPQGGMGTLAEITHVFHLNQIEGSIFGKIRPIIFYGSKWKKFIPSILRGLNLAGQSSGKGWVFFVNSLTEFENILVKLQK